MANDMKNKDDFIIYQNFENTPEICTSEHLNVCMCQKKLYDELLKKNYKKEVTDWLKKEKELNVNLPSHEIENIITVGTKEAKKRALKELSKYCREQDIRCPIEKEEILKDLRLFYEKYNDIWSDVRVQVVMESMINFKLSSHRMQKYSNKYGILQETWDRDGNRHLSLNAVEAEKRKYDMERIKAVEILDRMIEGTKSLVVNVDTDPIPISDLYKRRSVE